MEDRLIGGRMGPIGFFWFSWKEISKQQDQDGEDEDRERDEVEGVQTIFSSGVEVDVSDGEVFRGDGREVEEDNGI
jgi:hypothetical protein